MGSYADLTAAQKKATDPWILTEADKAAVNAGMWWDLESASYTIWWIERFCKLYEGAYAGNPLYIHGYADQPIPQEIYDFYADLDYSLDVFKTRFEDYYRARDDKDIVQGWQLDFHARCYGWKQNSARWAKHGIPVIRRFKSASVFVPKKSGKMLDVETPIPTPNGWKRNGDLEAGDVVFDTHGKPCNITAAHPEQVSDNSFLITFSNGEQVKACGDHLWLLETRSRKSKDSPQKDKGYEDTWTTQEMFDAGVMQHGNARRFRITLHEGLQDLPAKALPIDPYSLGAWLGDGSSDRWGFTCHEGDQEHLVAQMAADGYAIRVDKSNASGSTKSLTFDNAFNLALHADGEPGHFYNTGSATLRSEGLWNNKHIPEQYLRASREQRIALLQGLMDTDGCVNGKGKQFNFTNVNSNLAEGMCELLASLGIKYSCELIDTAYTYKGEKKFSKAWSINFMVFRDHVEAFRLPRKLDRQLYSTGGVMQGKRSRTVQIVSIERCEPTLMRCITVDSPSSTYLFGKTMLPTHNSPTMAANIVYMSCGDGEPGNKVFIGAADLDQAGIAWLHSYNMIMQSPELKVECKPNMSTKRVQHLPSNSFFEPMSSANSRSQNAKEGLNGSVCLDEIHVLDNEFVAILEYAGVSRAEPLQLEFSTAGKNPEAYGATRWTYGESVNAGEILNLHHLHVSYNAPQSLTAEQLAEDPEKYIRMANPALGHTVDMEELLPAYHAAKSSTYALRKYMMYRLNVWQNAASSWLDPGLWAVCGRKKFNEQNLETRPCVIGLDLARRYDLACAVFAFLGDPEEGQEEHPVLIRPFFWCAEDIIRDRSTKIKEMPDWQASGAIKSTSGNVIDFRVIEHDLRDMIKKYNVVGITYDSTYAEDLIQRLTEGVVGPNGEFVYEPLAIGEKSVSQSIMSMTGMTTDLENDIKRGRIQHENHPVLTWQIGNASVKEDHSGNVKIIKENRDSYRTVDGVVAMVMARWGLLDCNDFNATSFDYYLNNDVEFI